MITASTVGAKPELRRQVGRGEIAKPELRQAEIADVVAAAEGQPHVSAERHVNLAARRHFSCTAHLLNHIGGVPTRVLRDEAYIDRVDTNRWPRGASADAEIAVKTHPSHVEERTTVDGPVTANTGAIIPPCPSIFLANRKRQSDSRCSRCRQVGLVRGRLSSTEPADGRSHRRHAGLCIRSERGSARYTDSMSSVASATGLMAIMTVASLLAQQPPPTPINPENIPTAPPAVAKLGPESLPHRGNHSRHDQARSVGGRKSQRRRDCWNSWPIRRDGLKAYESALTTDTYAVTFNAAMLLIGLDKDHARVPTSTFRSGRPRKAIASLLWIDWTRAGEHVRTPAEQLLFDKETRKPIPPSDWVYTGSTFVREGPTHKSTRYVADIDGVLIGFVHSPAPDHREHRRCRRRAATGSSS